MTGKCPHKQYRSQDQGSQIKDAAYVHIHATHGDLNEQLIVNALLSCRQKNPIERDVLICVCSDIFSIFWGERTANLYAVFCPRLILESAFDRG